MNKDLPFEDRKEAGVRLGRMLAEMETCHGALVLGLVRGGAEIAYHMASAAGLEWDIMVVRKIGAPQQPEYAIGAYAETGSYMLNQDAASRLGLPQDWFNHAFSKAQQECTKLQHELRGDESPLDCRGRKVILTDDGVATGMTMRAAIEAAQHSGALSVMVAVPVLAVEARAMLQETGVELHYLACPANFHAVGQFYRDFSPVTSECVQMLLRARRRLPVARAVPPPIQAVPESY